MNTAKPSDMPKKGYIAFITLIATFGGLLFGYDTAVISGGVKALESYFLSEMHTNTAYANEVLSDYKTLVTFVWLIVIITFTSMIFRMHKRKKAGIYATVFIIAGLSSLSIYYFRSSVVTESTISAIKGFTISSALVGCIIGGALAGRVSIYLGRKKGLILATSLFAISAIGSAIPDKLNIFHTQDIISFIIYRIIGGIGVGLASMLTPMYIAEIAPSNIRGKLVSWNQFAIIFGMLVIYVVNYLIAHGQTDEWINTIGWRYMFVSELAPALLFFFMLFFVPETPRYLILKNKDAEATRVMSKIFGYNRVPPIMKEIKNSFKEKSRLWLYFGFTVIIVGILLSVFQQFVGINVILYYAPAIFKNLGFDTTASYLQTIIVGAVNLAFTLLAIFSVDKYGRKKLQIIGAAGMAFAMISLGMVFYTGNMGIAALVFMLIFIASFAMSWGPVTWVLLSEIFPNSIRGAMSLAVAAQWIANLAVSWTFPMMNDNTYLVSKFNHGFAFWVYGFMSILAMIFVWRLVPETKGKSLEAIEKIWKK